MFKICGREISNQHKPYMIAEMSANHNGSIERAKETIKAAKLSGADAVKMQSYTADTMTIDCKKDHFQIKEGLWKGYSLYKLYEEAHTPFEWHKELFEFAKDLGITLFSTPFDETAVDLLETLDTPAYKIASFELVDLPLVKCVAETQKPVLMSTGMASLEEISEAVETVKSVGNEQILLFHCVSSYPAPLVESNLRIIEILKREFDVEVGLSDHTMSHTAAIIAVALGAVAIEKHFKVDANEDGPDSSFSLLPDELRSLVGECEDVWAALGSNLFNRAKAEKSSLVFRRSLYFVRDKKAGEVITTDDIRRIRPGNGVAPKYFEKIIGRKLSEDVERGDPVVWDVLES